MITITGVDIQRMVRHWLGTPEGSYLSSSYGSNITELLQRPQLDGMADFVILKMKSDIPILQSLPAGSINIFSMASSVDGANLVIEVLGFEVEIPRNFEAPLNLDLDDVGAYVANGYFENNYV